MEIKIKANFNKSEIQGHIEKVIAQAIEEKKRKTIRMLMYIGEQCVNDARLKGSYTDRTGNLRGSTGYGVVVDGRLVDVSGFEQVKQGGDGPEKGRRYLEELVAQFPKGIVLIVVAGENYAQYVQDKGYNVLDSAENLAEKLITSLQKQML